MKVTVIFPDSISKPVGGLGVQFKNLYYRLKDKINYNIVDHPDEDNGIKEYISVSHPIPNITHGTINTLLSHTVYLAKALQLPKPDIIHAYDWSTYFAGTYLAEIYNVPLLLSMQLSSNALANSGIYNCTNINTHDGYWLHKTHVESEYYGLNKADKIINVSNGYTRYFPQFNDKTIVIPNGISLKEWTPTEKIKLPGDRRYKIIYIGRFSFMKSVDALLNIDIPDNIDLIFVGAQNGGDYECIKKLEEQINNQKSGLYYYGPAYNQEKINLLFSADAVIMPSKHEPFGIVALEALASKSILLASRVDGLGDFLTNQNSINCGYTVDSITNALNYFLSLTEEQKQSLINNGLETCVKYDWDNIAESYYNVYKSLLQK